MEGIVEDKTPEAQTVVAEPAQPQDSAPEKTSDQTKTGAQVDGTQEKASRPEVSGDDVPKGLKKELYSLRSKNREYRQTLESMQARLDAIEKSRTQPVEPASNGQKSDVSLFDNPDAFLAERDKKILADAESRVMTKIKAEEQQAKHLVAAEEAEKWLLSQNYLKEDPEAIEEINDIIASDDIQALTAVNPRIAAKEAYSRWCESKGVGSSRQETAKASTARAASPKPSGVSGSSAPKIWKAAELEAYANSLDHRSPDFAQKWAEVEKAMKEKRITK